MFFLPVVKDHASLVTCLTHWGRVTHICAGNLTNIGSDNGLSPGRRQAITWTNVGMMFIVPLGTHFSEMLVEIQTFSFKKIHLKMSSGKWRPFCLGLNVLTLSHFLNQCWPFIIWTNGNIAMKFESKYNNFHTTKWIWKCYLQNGSHFVLASMSK